MTDKTLEQSWTPQQAIDTLNEYMLAVTDEDSGESTVTYGQASTALARLRMVALALVAVSAERDVLKAQLDAVPVQAIALYWDATFVDYGRIAHEDHMKVAQADEAVENWLAEVKYGKAEVTK